MKYTKKLPLILSMVLCMSLFSSCGTTKKDSAATPAPSQSADSSSEKAPEPRENAPEAVKEEITLWHALSGIHEEALNNMVEKYNSSQENYVVVPTNQGDYATLQQKIMAATKSKSLPTLSQALSTSIPDYVQNNIIVSIDSYVNGDNGLTEDDIKDIYSVFLEGAIYQEKYYSMPFSKSNRIMFYNEDIITEHGVEIPTSWEDVEAAGETLADAGIIAMGLDTDYSREFETMVLQSGTALIEPGTKTVNVNSENSVETLEYIQELIGKGYVKTAGEDKYFSKAFARGESAFFIASSAGISAVTEIMDPSVNWGTAVIPTYKGTQKTQVAGNDLVMHPNSTEAQMDGAWDFIKFTLEAENTAEWSIATGYLPVRQSALETDVYQQLLIDNPNYKAAIDELPYGYVSPSFVGYNEYNGKLKEGLNNVVVSDLSSKEMLDSVQAIVEKTMK